MLLVSDLKLGDRSGAVALWIGVRTEAYFSPICDSSPRCPDPLLTG